MSAGWMTGLGKGMGSPGLTREGSEKAFCFWSEYESHGQKGVLFLSGKVLSVIH